MSITAFILTSPVLPCKHLSRIYQDLLCITSQVHAFFRAFFISFFEAFFQTFFHAFFTPFFKVFFQTFFTSFFTPLWYIQYMHSVEHSFMHSFKHYSRPGYGGPHPTPPAFDPYTACEEAHSDFHVKIYAERKIHPVAICSAG